MADNICPQCGHLNRQGARFCKACGSSLPASSSPQPTPPYSPPAARPPAYQTPAPQPVYVPPETPAPPRRSPRPVPRSEACLITLLAQGVAVLFILLVCIALPVWRAGQVFLSATTYKDALANRDFSGRFPALFVEQMDAERPTELKMEGMACINTANFTRADWQAISDQFLKPDWLQGQIDSLIDQSFTYLETKGAPLALEIEMAQFKDLFNSQAGFDFYQSLVASKNACNFFDLAAIGLWVLNPQGSCLAVCSPPFDLDQNTWQIIGALAGSMPTHYPLDYFVDISLLADLKPLYQLASWIQTAAKVLLPAAFLLLPLTLISRRARSIHGGLLYFGLPLLLSGLLCLLIAGAIYFGADLLVGSIATSNNLVTGMRDLISDVTGEITRQAALAILLPALALLLPGALLSAIGAGWWFLGRQKRF